MNYWKSLKNWLNQQLGPFDPSVPRWLTFVAALTGTLAAVAGYVTVRATHLANEAIFHSNQALLSQQQASDSWAEYEADSIKARIVETAILTTTNAAAIQNLKSEETKYRAKQSVLKETAQRFEKDRNEKLALSGRRRIDRDVLNYAGVAVQLGIALASIAAMLKHRTAFICAVIVGGFGIIIVVYGMIIQALH